MNHGSLASNNLPKIFQAIERADVDFRVLLSAYRRIKAKRMRVSWSLVVRKSIFSDGAPQESRTVLPSPQSRLTLSRKQGWFDLDTIPGRVLFARRFYAQWQVRIIQSGKLSLMTSSCRDQSATFLPIGIENFDDGFETHILPRNFSRNVVSGFREAIWLLFRAIIPLDLSRNSGVSVSSATTPFNKPKRPRTGKYF